jgi:hypothetical protein
MGPPEEVDVAGKLGELEKGFGDEGAEENWLALGGNVSHERVRRQDCRIMEKEDGERGSWVEV